MVIEFERPRLEVIALKSIRILISNWYVQTVPIMRGRIPPKSLTQQRFTAIIKRNKGEQDQVDTLKSQRKIFKLLDRIFIMYDFNVKGDMGRHILSISGASSECGISTSTINREIEKGTFPPKQKISGRRIGFFVYQIEQWLKGKRGGWN